MIYHMVTVKIFRGDWFNLQCPYTKMSQNKIQTCNDGDGRSGGATRNR